MGDSQLSAVELPDEINREILSCLPVKSLIRFSSVCKSWRHLIRRDQSFIKQQMNQAIKRRHYSPEFIIHSKVNRFSMQNAELEEHDVVKLKNRGLCNPVSLEKDFVFAGSCNGVICLVKGNFETHRSRIYLWNPALHQCRILPSSAYLYLTSIDFLALVYDSLDDDHKVVILDGGQRIRGEFGSYSLKRDCWRTIQCQNEPSHRYNLNRYFVEWNGKPHWLSFRLQNENNMSLLVFDGEREGFHEIQTPESVSNAFYCGIGLSQGCLSLFACVKEVGHVVWSMEFDGKWTRKLVLENKKPIPGIRSFLGISKSGKFLVEGTLGIGLFDADKNCVEKLGFSWYANDPDYVHYYFITDHVETMVNILPDKNAFDDVETLDMK